MYPSGEPGVTVRYVTLDDGVSLRVAESGPAKDEAVLLVHGWAASMYSFAEMIPALAAAGHRAIAVDLPGHGLSDKPTDESHYSTEALGSAVLRLAGELGLRRFSIVGHSMGGAIGLELAARGERKLERLVLIGTVGLSPVPAILPLKWLSPRPAVRLFSILVRRRVVDLVLRVMFATPNRPTQRDIDEYWAPTQFHEYLAACRACLHRFTWSPLPETKLQSLDVPVLVIGGAHDFATKKNAERAKLIPSARIVTIPGGGHVVQQECAPLTNEAIVHFLGNAKSS